MSRPWTVLRARERATPPRRRALPALALMIAIVGGGWSYLLYLASGMQDMRRGIDMWIMPRMTQWGTTDLFLVFVMWAVMMAAMMLPSVTATVTRWAAAPTGGGAGAAGFVAGYLLVWGGFSIAATGVQWALLHSALVSPMMESTSTLLSAAVFLGAGLYQFTPLKRRCLGRCRAALSLPGAEQTPAGAVSAGLRSGAACLGCCWALMLLLFATGVMNVAAMLVLSGYVLAEKMAPGAEGLSRVAGAVLCVAGIALLV